MNKIKKLMDEMKKLIIAIILSTGTIASGAAQAEILEFDVSGIGTTAGTLSGIFLFDTSTQAVTDISVTGLAELGSVVYDSTATAESRLVHDGTDPAPFDFTQIELYFDSSLTTLLRFEIAGFQTTGSSGLLVGEQFSSVVTGIEIASGVGSRAFVNSSFVMKRLADPNQGPTTVPLPAILPLMLAGFGALVLTRRKRG